MKLKKQLSESFNKQLKGSTLVEVLVALLLITISFSLAALIYVRVMESSRVEEIIKSRIIINNLWNDSPLDSKEQLIQEDIIFRISKSEYKSSGELIVVEIEAFGKDSTFLSSSKKVLRYEDE